MPNPIKHGAATIAAIAHIAPSEILWRKKKAIATIPTDEPAQYWAMGISGFDEHCLISSLMVSGEYGEVVRK